MNKTPNANRIHITLIGKRNAGKSSLLNAILGSEVSLVSNIKGTTTDPIQKTMELGDLGPVLFIDTAGIDDEGELGTLRVERTLKVLEKTDFALYIMDAEDIDTNILDDMILTLKKYKIPFLKVMNKIDELAESELSELKEQYKDFIFVSAKDNISIHDLREEIILKAKESEESSIIGDLIPCGGNVLLVVPLDSGAPKGRLILPQVQIIRDCLDHGIKCFVTRDSELESALLDIKNIDLVITDSQIFKKVNDLLPKEIRLTSFSILFARYKGDLNIFLEGVRAIEKLEENSNILISESCSHAASHEDIGRIKIPNLLNQVTNKKFNYTFQFGEEFPKELSKYDLVIHCGSCMLNKKIMITRMNYCKEQNVPITNYGVVLAYLSGILNRTIEIF